MLNPADRQNYDSAIGICDDRVIKMLNKHVPESKATVLFLQIISDCTASYMSVDLSPLDRIRKLWHALFMTRMWRFFVDNHPNLTTAENFMSANCYSCLEQNAHSMVLIILFLKKNNLPELFVPTFFNSQPCEEFYRQIRSFTSTYSTVVTCTVKEILGRISKIQLVNEISHEKESGFFYPKSQKSVNLHGENIKHYDLPSEDEIFRAVRESQREAVKSAIQIGLIDNTVANKKNSCFCHISPYIPRKKKASRLKKRITKKNHLSTDIYESSLITSMKLNQNLRLTNYAHLFLKKIVPANSPYVEIPSCKTRFIARKTSWCWLLGKETQKLSSDRLLRVTGSNHVKYKISKKNCIGRKKYNNSNAKRKEKNSPTNLLIIQTVLKVFNTIQTHFCNIL